MVPSLLVSALCAFVGVARADSITLDSGAVIEGDLARFEFGGDCQISVTEGTLVGAIVIVPCRRVQSFVRTATAAPKAVGVVDPPIAAAVVAPSAAPVAGQVAAPVAGKVVTLAAPVAAAPVAAAPVAAALVTSAPVAAAPVAAAPVVVTPAPVESPAVAVTAFASGGPQVVSEEPLGLAGGAEVPVIPGQASPAAAAPTADPFEGDGFFALTPRAPSALNQPRAAPSMDAPAAAAGTAAPTSTAAAPASSTESTSTSRKAVSF